MSTPEHWDAAYAAGDTTRGWYQPTASVSLQLLSDYASDPSASIVDIGAGASVFVDDALAAGYRDITLLDHSPVGLAVARERLGASADTVTWVEADLRDWQPGRTFDVWHDRAVLHFLLDEDDRADYHRCLVEGTHPGSLIIIGVFGPEGPPMCAGLPVRRYDSVAVAEWLGDDVDVIDQHTRDHVRPDGDAQQYLWTVARRVR
jgi:hypothetical protein